ncbi:SpoIIE family protein phosphatase [Actinomycetospora endophytica]|uniref:SpoIIE family protein phosphatase n=1 Tax=Actinomycetospora endophytica TaxID=2291215 RepID=A0ABS8P164_9PSEU|nr:SpoIIE family protein phosphatase [Actinomycetospora endophytica]MCD2191985.1 SpoIIE family protein phosphatase [Actinomycetospora endophytica]
MPDRDDELRRTVGEAGQVRQAFEELPLMMAAMDGPELRFVAANAAYRALAGSSAFIGEPLRGVFPEVGGQQVFEAVERVYATAEPYSMHEWRMQFGMDDSGQPKELFLDVHLVPRFTAEGEKRGVVGYITDVTALVTARLAAQTKAAEVERRYEQARDVIALLQRELLSPGLPVLPGVRVAASYLLADAETAAGGDWFDALPLSDGRVGLVVGDVVGHGVAASAVMGQLRAIAAERLHSGATIADALAAVDAVADRVPGARAATVCAAVLDPATGALSYCTAGHPPPLVVPVSGEPGYLPISGAGPLGTGSEFPLAKAVLEVGDVLLCYTDGIIERPGRTRVESTAELTRVAADGAAGRGFHTGEFSAVERVCTQTLELLVRATGHGDDITLLAVQRREPLPPLELTLPAEPETVGVLRAQLRAWLVELGVSPDDLFRVPHAVNELVTNAVDHAYPDGDPGPVSLSASVDTTGTLHASVSDRGTSAADGPDGVDDLRALPLHVERGRGLAMTRRLLDLLDLEQGGQGTTATISHRLSRPARLLTADDVRGVVAPASPGIRAEFLLILDESSGRGPRIRLSGPVDADNATKLRTALAGHTLGGPDQLVVNLSDVTLLASAGIAVLAAARTRAAAGMLQLYAAVGSEADQVLTLVGFDHTTEDPDRQPPNHQVNATTDAG